MRFKSFASAMGHLEQLKVFCRQVMKARLTPDLIRLVAGDKTYINYCREITNAGEQDRKRFASFCRRNGFDPDEIRTRVCLAASALGMYKHTDYYAILGVSSEADDTVIKQAYRKKAQMLHPDKFSGNLTNNDAFIELHAAYANLSDPGLRKVYDETRHCIGYWNEGAKFRPLSKEWSLVSRFIVWMGVMAAGTLIVVYAFDAYQSRSSYFSSQGPAEACLEKSGPTFVAVPAKKAAAVETAKIKAEQGANSRSEVDDGSPSDATSGSMQKVKSAGFSKKIKKSGTGKTIEAAGVSRLKKTTPAKATEGMVNKSKPALRNGRKVPAVVKAVVPKKAAHPVSGTRLPDVSAVSGGQKPPVVKAVAKKKEIDTSTLYLLQKLRVLSFLQNYTKTYEEKNLTKFRTFFSKTALEQGRPFDTLLSTYQKTFNRVEALKYKIELTSVSLESGGNKIYIEGNFTTRYQLPEEDWCSCIGSIHMELLDEPEGFLVSRLDYDVQGR